VRQTKQDKAKYCYRSCRLRSVAQTRRDEILPCMGILLGGNTAPGIISSMRQKKHV